MDYLKRIADEELSLRLEAFGAVQIKGPKWCGKTTTAERRHIQNFSVLHPHQFCLGIRRQLVMETAQHAV